MKQKRLFNYELGVILILKQNVTLACPSCIDPSLERVVASKKLKKANLYHFSSRSRVPARDSRVNLALHARVRRAFIFDWLLFVFFFSFFSVLVVIAT